MRRPRKRKGGRGRAAAPGEGSERQLHTRVRTAKGRKASSTRWLERQLNDPFVAAARRLGYRSRAAFKITEIDERFHLFRPGATVVDLGAAPGGWSQVAVQKVGKSGRVIAIDILEMEGLPGVDAIQMDFLDPDAPDRLMKLAGGPVDVVMSDMAASATGHAPTDHLRIMALCEAALEFAEDILKPGGAFVAKVLQGGTEQALLERMKREFAQVKHAKPKASRADSAESYVVATGFRGR